MAKATLVNNLDAQGFLVRNSALPLLPGDLTNKQYVDSLTGGVGLFYLHEQNIPATIWNVTHNLGYKPNVRVENSSGDYILTQISDLNDNSLQIIFNNANAGKAHCS